MANALDEANYFTENFQRPNYPDVPGTLAMESRSGNAIVDKYNDMKRRQALVDVSDIGIAGPAMAARGIASQFVRPAVNPAAVLRANPNIGQNAAMSTAEVGVPQGAYQGAQDVAEAIGRVPAPKMNFNAEKIFEPYVVPSKEMKGYKNLDAFDTLNKAGVMNKTGDIQGGQEAVNAFWKANPKLADKVKASENRSAQKSYAETPSEKRGNNAEFIDHWENKGEIPYKNPKNKMQIRRNQKVQERLDAEMERGLALSDEDFMNAAPGSLGEAFLKAVQ